MNFQPVRPATAQAALPIGYHTTSARAAGALCCYCFGPCNAHLYEQTRLAKRGFGDMVARYHHANLHDNVTLYTQTRRGFKSLTSRNAHAQREYFAPPTSAKQVWSLGSNPCSSSSWRQASSWKPSQTSSSWRLPDQRPAGATPIMLLICSCESVPPWESVANCCGEMLYTGGAICRTCPCWTTC